MAKQLAVLGDRHQEIRAVAETKHLMPVVQFLKWCKVLYVMVTVLWKKGGKGLDTVCYSCAFKITWWLCTKYLTTRSLVKMQKTSLPKSRFWYFFLWNFLCLAIFFNFFTNITCHFTTVESTECETQRGCLGGRSYNESSWCVWEAVWWRKKLLPLPA